MPFDVSRVISAYQAGAQLKRQNAQDAFAKEEHDLEVQRRQIELKALKWSADHQEAQARRAEAAQYAQMLTGQPGQIPGISLSSTPGGPQADVGAQAPVQGPPENVAQMLAQRARSQPVQLQSAPIPGAQTPPTQPGVIMPGDFGPSAIVHPQSAEQQQADTLKNEVQKMMLQRQANTYTVTEPTTGQTFTGPKELVDNLVSNAGQAARLAQQQEFTSGENAARLQAESDRAVADRASREKIAAERIQAAAVKAAADGKSSKNNTLASNWANQFNANDIVKNYAVVQDGLNFAKKLGETSADDIGLIYAFAKAMDPNSVVREGEYATVQKYAQSWAQAFGFKVERMVANTRFLSEEARKNMIATISAKADAAKISYDNFASETAKKFKNINYDPKEWLANFNLPRDAASGGTVKMKAPNGQTQDVPADQVEHYKSLGATVVK